MINLPALDTINETAREGAPAEAVGEATPAEPEQKSKAAMQTSEADAAGPPRPPALQLETSTLRRIGAGKWHPKETIFDMCVIRTFFFMLRAIKPTGE